MVPHDVEIVQRGRLERIAREIDPNCLVDFILDRSHTIRFRIFDTRSGDLLIERSGSWEPSRLAGMSDESVAELLELLSTGKMGQDRVNPFGAEIHAKAENLTVSQIWRRRLMPS